MDINKIPFSRFNSFLTISPLWNDDGFLYIRTVRGGDMDSDCGKVFKICTLNSNGEVIPYRVIMSEIELVLETDCGRVRICFEDGNTIRWFGENIILRLEMSSGSYDNAIPFGNNRFKVNCFKHDIKYIVEAIEGSLSVDAPWEGIRSKYVKLDFIPKEGTRHFHGVIEEFKPVWKERKYERSYESCLNSVKVNYEEWVDKIPQVLEEFEPGRRLATYITWSCVVPKTGRLTRPAMYMSKNWMTNIWSWDHCFNAMALIKNNPDLAWSQFMIPFDLQDESGLLPDFVNDKYEYFSCTKPPIHGWTLNWMMEENPEFFTHEKLKEIYIPLVKWTEYWFKYTTDGIDNVPTYSHGNDAGWDNSTAFINGAPLKSPDLLSFLILQMKTIEKLSIMLGIDGEAEVWKKRKEETVKLLIDYFWEKDKFIPKREGCTAKDFDGDSLIMLVPIVLGELLPREIRNILIQGIKEEGRFLTPYGLATESLKSKYYKDDGYWRGPIWAPSTMLIVDGLKRAGEDELAKDIALRYVKMANRSGMAENFNAKTGEGLRDKAFTWTSSVYLILGSKYI